MGTFTPSSSYGSVGALALVPFAASSTSTLSTPSVVVSVTNSKDVVAYSRQATFTITALSPTYGPSTGGTTVTVAGSGFFTQVMTSLEMGAMKPCAKN